MRALGSEVLAKGRDLMDGALRSQVILAAVGAVNAEGPSVPCSSRPLEQVASLAG